MSMPDGRNKPDPPLALIHHIRASQRKSELDEQMSVSHTRKEGRHVHVQCHKPARQPCRASAVRNGFVGDHRRVVSRSDLAEIIEDVLAGLNARAEVMGERR